MEVFKKEPAKIRGIGEEIGNEVEFWTECDYLRCIRNQDIFITWFTAMDLEGLEVCRAKAVVSRFRRKHKGSEETELFRCRACCFQTSVFESNFP